MATTELPDWENTRGPKKSIFSRVNPLSYIARWTAPPSFPVPKRFELSTVASPSSAGTFDKETQFSPLSNQQVAAAPAARRRRYCSFSRNTYIALAVLSVCILALIIGLAVGLQKRHKSSSQNLPLPSSNQTFTGDITYYAPGLGACGFVNSSTDAICAVSEILWDAVSTSTNPNNNPLCQKMIRITRFDPTSGSNHSVDVEVVDRCVACAATDLDLSLAMFTHLADESIGRTLASWAWLD